MRKEREQRVHLAVNDEEVETVEDEEGESQGQPSNE